MDVPDNPQVRPVLTAQDIDSVRQWFREYQSDLGIDLCFQSFEEDSLHGQAGMPRRTGRYCSLLLTEARGTGLGRMRLDTMPVLERAIAMYRRIGFADCAPYTNTPGAVWLELVL